MKLAQVASRWAPEPRKVTESIDARPARALAGLLDQPSPVEGTGAALPAGWHQLYFLDRSAQAELGRDGHPAAGHFLPPIERRRRMFAGGRLTTHHPLPIGEVVDRTTEVVGTRLTAGRTGDLLFVTLRHRFTAAGQLMVEEEQDLVYRQDTEPGSGLGPAGSSRPRAPELPATQPWNGTDGPSNRWRVTMATDPIVLFRFSALTYNSHRIHYDLDYVTGEEGFPGLVVHGPLLALLSLELPRRRNPNRVVERFEYQLRRPVFCGALIVAVADPDTGHVTAGVDGHAPSLSGTFTFPS